MNYIRESKTGRFTKKSILDKKNRASELGKARNKTFRKSVCDGQRIVNINTLAELMICDQCKENLSFKDIIGKEKRRGLYSTWQIKCQKCSTVTAVHSGKTHKNDKSSCKSCNVNYQAVLGSMKAGIGCTALNKILSSLNIPVISDALFRRYKQEVGPKIEETAQECCKRDVEEECRLMIENIQKQEKELPEDMDNKEENN